MIQHKQPKKVKGARKKAREEVIDRLQTKYPTWFEGKTDNQIKVLVGAFKATGMNDDSFPSFCTYYEAKLEQDYIV